MEFNRYKGSLTVEQLIVAHEKIKANANSLAFLTHMKI